MKNLRIALIGYGKMGKAIEEIAVQRGHVIVLKIDASNRGSLTPELLQTADVAIEFTGPEFAVENILFCLDAGVPVLSGSTGWAHREKEVEEKCRAVNGTLLYTGNFSIGVNMFFAVNRKLAELMSRQPAYKVAVSEVHHTQKKDAPSGTAILLANDIVAAHPNLRAWAPAAAAGLQDLAIESLREDPAPGTHTITYTSSADDILIRHTARNRSGFADGAVTAAEFIFDKSGIFRMSDVLGF